jgi:hypothetical protein
MLIELTKPTFFDTISLSCEAMAHLLDAATLMISQEVIKWTAK